MTPLNPEALEKAAEAIARRRGVWMNTARTVEIYAEDARAAITAYMECDGWRDIASAPKDGTRILVWFQYTAEGIARAGVTGRIEVAHWSVSCGAWFLDHDAYDDGHRPSLWMPLAPPPAGSGRNLADANPKAPSHE